MSSRHRQTQVFGQHVSPLYQALNRLGSCTSARAATLHTPSHAILSTRCTCLGRRRADHHPVRGKQGGPGEIPVALDQPPHFVVDQQQQLLGCVLVPDTDCLEDLCYLLLRLALTLSASGAIAAVSCLQAGKLRAT